MKYILAAIFSLGLLSTLCFAGEKVELKDLKDKETTAWGTSLDKV